MKFKVLATSLVLCLLASAAALAVETSAVSPTPQRSVSTQQVGEGPMLLAADSSQLEQLSARLQQKNSKQVSKSMQRRSVRETNPWWR
tara:strand:+ start:30981 stop:31244 length:264 start_codon:yes stop_codon:yes gene_type:complete